MKIITNLVDKKEKRTNLPGIVMKQAWNSRKYLLFKNYFKNFFFNILLVILIS